MSTVAVYAPPCIGRPFDRSSLGGLLRVELRALGVTNVFIDSPESAATPLREAPLAVVIVAPATCEAAAQELTIRVVDRTIPKSLERRMLISDIDVAERSRALAIGIAELLAAAFAELELAGAPQGLGVPNSIRAAIVARVVPVAEAASRGATREVDARFDDRERKDSDAAKSRESALRAPSVDVDVIARSFPSGDTALLGAAIGARLRPGTNWAAYFGANIAGGGAKVNVGSVTIRSASARVGAAVTTGGQTELEVGPALEVGYGWATGSSTSAEVQGQSYGNVLALALASATLRVHASAAWALSLGTDLGYAVSGVSFLSDNARVAGIEGVSVGLRAGVSIAF